MSKKTINGVVIELNPAALAELLRSPSGPVYRKMIVNAEDVRQEAKRRVGVYKGDTAYRKRPPGQMRDSIVKRPVLINGDIGFIVGTEDPAAIYHHEGTEAHIIVPVRRPKLVFFWARVGKVVAFTKVHHPGTRPNHFLTDALDILRGR